MEGLEKIEIEAFKESGLESIALPSSVREVCAYAFSECDCLRSV